MRVTKKSQLLSDRSLDMSNRPCIETCLFLVENISNETRTFLYELRRFSDEKS